MARRACGLAASVVCYDADKAAWVQFFVLYYNPYIAILSLIG